MPWQATGTRAGWGGGEEERGEEGGEVPGPAATTAANFSPA